MDFGAFLITGFKGTAVSRTLKNLILKHNLFGVILFSRNFKSAEQIKTLCGDLQELKQQVSASPLVIAIDYEGGFVSRFPQAIPWLPSAASQGKSGRPSWTREFYFENAFHLKALGINCNFAPVLDIPASKDHTIGIRSFSLSAKEVGLFGKAAIAGIHEGGLLACGKHFPGLGRTKSDPHFSLPVVSESLAAFRRCDLLPFVEGVKSGLQFFMTSHAHYRALDPENPATLSPAINQRLLRETLGFKGLLISDDLCMKAMKGSLAELSLKAFLNGVDIPMICHSLEEVEEVILCNTQKLKTPRGLKRMEETEERMQGVLERLSELAAQKTVRLSLKERKSLEKKKKAIAADSIRTFRSFKACSIKNMEGPLLLYSDILSSNNAEENFGILGLKAMLASLFPSIVTAPLSQGLEKIKNRSSSGLFLVASGLDEDLSENPVFKYLKQKKQKFEITFCVKNPSDVKKVLPFSRNIVSTCGLQRENILALKRFLISKKDEIGYTSLPGVKGKKNGQPKKID